MSRVARALALAGALSLLPAVLHAADPYADFRVPDHRSFSWTLKTNGGINSAQNDQANAVVRSSGAQQGLSSSLLWSRESEARVSDFSAGLTSSLSQSRSRFEQDPTFTKGSAFNRNDRLSLTIGGDERDYLGGSRYAIEVDAQTTLDFDHVGNSSATRFASAPIEDNAGTEFHNRLYRQAGSASVGIGRGRVRDVTGVFSAQLIEQRLLATGRLARPLSPGARLRIAQLHYIASDFSAAHDRPTRYFWREVERVLREDGALADSTLDAYSVLRVLEPAFGSAVSFRRTIGVFVQPFFFGSEVRGHEDVDQRTSRLVLDNGTPVLDDLVQSSTRIGLDRKASGVGLSAEVHRPVGMRWQSDGVVSAQVAGGSQRELSVVELVQLQYMLADRWYTFGSLQHQFRSLRLDGVRTEPAWIFNGQASLSYLVEDSWSLDTAYTLSQAQGRNGEFSNVAIFARSSGFRFGITYRPFGRFDAPGLGVSQHLVTPAL